MQQNPKQQQILLSVCEELINKQAFKQLNSSQLGSTLQVRLVLGKIINPLSIPIMASQWQGQSQPQSQLQLPPSVEHLLSSIASQHMIDSADVSARRQLCNLGEQRALSILRKISRSPSVRSLSRFIVYMIREDFPDFTALQQDFNSHTSIAISSSAVDSISSTGSTYNGDGCQQEEEEEEEEDDVSQCGSDVSSYHTAERNLSGVSSASSIAVSDTLQADNDIDEHNDCEVLSECGLGMRQTSISLGHDQAGTNRNSCSDHLAALGKLAFPKRFLVLANCDPFPLEKLLSADDIIAFKPMSMASVKQFMAERLRSKNACDLQFAKDSQKHVWWDRNPDDENFDKSDFHLEYHCYVDLAGDYSLQGPIKGDTRTRMHRVLGDSNVLQVHFGEEKLAEETPEKVHQKLTNDVKAIYQRIAKQGLVVGLREYHFFVFKESDNGRGKQKLKKKVKSSVKCYFVCTSSSAEVDDEESYSLFTGSVHKARCQFMHINNAKSLKHYISRFALILSKTLPFDYDLSTVHVRLEEDISCSDENNGQVYDTNGEPLIHTDGTGFISEDLCSKIRCSVTNGISCTKSLEDCPPLLTQCRLFYEGYAIKGTLLLNKNLQPQTICIRESMVKVAKDDKKAHSRCGSSLEVVNTVRKPYNGYLSQPLIALLTYGGVPEKFFIELTQKALDEYDIACQDEKEAWKLFSQFKDMDDDNVILQMLTCGIPLEETYLQFKLKEFIKNKFKSIRKGKVRLENSYYLMGTADPSGKLKPNEVCIIMEHGQVSGKVLVYRNPGLHFGDIHVYNAKYVEEIEKIVGRSKYAIFFSIQGERSGADEMGMGDFDGDLYWICRNSEVLRYYTPHEPWQRPFEKKETLWEKPDFSSAEFEMQLFEEFLNCRFSPSYTVGLAADSWKVYMDRLLTKMVKETSERDALERKLLRLVDIFYQALKAPKSAKMVEFPEDLRPEKRPHFLNKNETINLDKFYKSTSILGKIADLQVSTILEHNDISMLPCFNDGAGEEYRDDWKFHYDNYRKEMSDALALGDSSGSSTVASIFLNYKQILYEATDLNGSKKEREKIYAEACCIYQVAYEFAKLKGDPSYCKFAWHVAGEALCEVYRRKTGEKQFLISASKLDSLLGCL